MCLCVLETIASRICRRLLSFSFCVFGIFGGFSGFLGTDANQTSINTSLQKHRKRLIIHVTSMAVALVCTNRQELILTRRNVWYALNLRSSSVIWRNSISAAGLLIGNTGPLCCVAVLRSSSVASPLRNLRLACTGNKINLLRYSFKRWMFSCCPSTDLLRRRRSTAIPMVWAKPGVIPAPCK